MEAGAGSWDFLEELKNDTPTLIVDIAFLLGFVSYIEVSGIIESCMAKRIDPIHYNLDEC